MQQKGFIKSTVSKTDARHKVVTFTAKGQKLLLKVQPVWTALQKAMQELGSEGAKSKKLLDALTAMENNLQKEGVYERVQKKMK